MQPNSRRSVSLLINAKAANCDVRGIVEAASQTFNDRLCKFFISHTLAETAHALEAIRHDESSQGLIIVGGDGTVNRCLPFLNGMKVPIALFPAGTANDLAHHLGMNIQWQHLKNRIDKNTHATLDLISVNECLFATVGGIGVPAILTKEINDWREKSALIKRGARALGSQIYTLFASYTICFDRTYLHNVRVSCDALQEDLKTGCILVCNQPFLGKDLKVAPRAETDDGFFDIALLRATSPLGLMRTLANMKLGLPSADVSHIRTKSLILEDLDGRPLRFFGDGETLVEGPRLALEIKPAALTVFAR